MKCPSCSASVPSSAVRCSACGRDIDRAATIAAAMKTVRTMKDDAGKTETAAPTATIARVAVIGAVVLGLLWAAGAVLRSVLGGRAASSVPAPASVPASVPAAPPPVEAEEPPAPQPAFVAPPAEAPVLETAAPKSRAVDASKAKEVPAPQPGRERPDGTWDSSLPPMGPGGPGR